MGAALACTPATNFFVCQSDAQCVDGDAMGFCDVKPFTIRCVAEPS